MILSARLQKVIRGEHRKRFTEKDRRKKNPKRKPGLLSAAEKKPASLRKKSQRLRSRLLLKKNFRQFSTLPREKKKLFRKLKLLLQNKYKNKTNRKKKR